jgi:hypothetical protein
MFGVGVGDTRVGEGEGVVVGGEFGEAVADERGATSYSLRLVFFLFFFWLVL